jgi:hypothetical protein
MHMQINVSGQWQVSNDEALRLRDRGDGRFFVKRSHRPGARKGRTRSRPAQIRNSRRLPPKIRISDSRWRAAIRCGEFP